MRCLFLAAGAHAFTLARHKEVDQSRPVTRVIELLKNMQKTLTKEQEDDQEIYERMQCWCTTNDKEKTEAIKEAETTIDMLQTRIEELTAQSARLNTEILNLNEEIAENQAALEKATQIRQKERDSFTKQEKDMIEAIGALKSAVAVLSKHHESLLQESDLISLASTIHLQMTRFPDAFALNTTPADRRILNQFVQAPGYKSYNARSGEIFGILKQMHESFSSDLSEAQRDELQKQTIFEQLKQSKNEQIAAGQALADKKTTEKANADNNNSEAQQQLDDVRANLSADQKYLINLKQKCALTDKEWEQRQHTRQEEIVAVGKAIEILSADDAHDTFSRTYVKPAFLELKAADRTKVVELIAAAAKKFNDPKLAHLVSSVKLDTFAKVKAAIDNLVAQIQKQKADDVAHRDWCIQSENQNEAETSQKGRDKIDTEGQIESSKVKIGQLSERIKLLKSEVADIEQQIKRAGEDREKQNKEFQQTIKDQRDTQKLLKSALEVLQRVYKKKEGLVQARSHSKAREPAGPPPPKGFNKFEQNAQSGGVVAMITQIIEDAKAMEAEAIGDEKDAQAAYEQLVLENNQSIEEKNKARVNDEQAKAEVEGELVEQEQALAGINGELELLSNSKMDIEKACAFIVKNFDIRQKAQDEEVEALREAKAIISGAKFGGSASAAPVIAAGGEIKDGTLPPTGFLQKEN